MSRIRKRGQFEAYGLKRAREGVKNTQVDKSLRLLEEFLRGKEVKNHQIHQVEAPKGQNRKTGKGIVKRR